MTVMELAKEDSQITGDRFVVEHEGSPFVGNRRCCVVDAEWQSVIQSGMTFKDAYQMAKRMNKDHNDGTRPDKIQIGKPERGGLLDASRNTNRSRTRCPNPTKNHLWL